MSEESAAAEVVVEKQKTVKDEVKDLVSGMYRLHGGDPRELNLDCSVMVSGIPTEFINDAYDQFNETLRTMLAASHALKSENITKIIRVPVADESAPNKSNALRALICFSDKMQQCRCLARKKNFEDDGQRVETLETLPDALLVISDEDRQILEDGLHEREENDGGEKHDKVKKEDPGVRKEVVKKTVVVSTDAKEMKENQLLMLTLAAVCTGFCSGLLLRQFDLSDSGRDLVGFPGEIFMQVLKLMVLPLIFSSLISSLGQMDASKSGKMSLIAVAYYLTTVIIASCIAVTVVFLFHPGNPEIKKHNLDEAVSQEASNLSALDSLLDLIRNMFPQNIVEATMYRSQTAFVVVRKKSIENGTNDQPVALKRTLKLTHGTNILGLIVFCTGFGIILSKLGGTVKVIVDFFVVLDKVVMKFIMVLMWFSPFGIISLIASSILDIDDIYKMMTTMALYVLTIMVCLFLHCVVAVPSLYFFITRKNPLDVVKGMVQPFVTAIGTASSGASLPQAISSVEENLKVDPRIAGFIMPLGNTINMDGNALYEAVAVIFIAQLNNVSLSFAQVITICVTATFASIGLNAVPAGLVSMFVILSTVNLPVSDISLLFTVDWLIDRVRTALNVLGDSYCACVVQYFMEKDLAREHQLLKEAKLEEGTSEGPDRPDQVA